MEINDKLKSELKNKSFDIKSILSSLSASDRKKVEEIMSSKEKSREFLNSPAAKEIIKKLTEGKK